MSGELRLFAPCPRGLEQALAAELAALGASGCAPVPGGVAFAGDLAVAYSANLRSRLASRVMVELCAGRYRDDDGLYKLAAAYEWERWFDETRTLRVDLTAVRSPLRSLNFATLRVKDGIVDRFRQRTGERPSIDTRSPDVRVQAFLEDRQATLYLDLSGEPLFKRGWRSGREDKGEAPLKENLAAGLLALSGWTPGEPLYDPFCGAGTIVIEAAQTALDIAPGIARPFGFEKLLAHDEALWARLRGDAIRHAQAARGAPPRIAGSDIDPAAIAQARRNLERAGLAAGAVSLSVLDFAKAKPPFEEAGFIVTNPPYGERLAFGGEARDPEQAFGAVLRERFGGWQAWMLSSDRGLPGRLRLREKRKAPLFNGALECRLFGFELGAPAARAPAAGAA